MMKTKKFLQSLFFYPSLVSLAVFLLSLLAWYFTSRNIRLHDEARFKLFSIQVEHELAYRLRSYVQVLVQTRNMFFVTEKVDRNEFREYVKHLKLYEEYQGFQGIGYSEKIREPLKEFEKKIQEEGYLDFKVWPQTPRKEYHSIIFLEPFNWRNQRAFGFDMYSHSIRREAMERARDEGAPAASGVVKLVQETREGVQYGVLIYVPLYKTPQSDLTIEERRQNLKGFIYGAFRIKDFFNNIFHHFDEANPVGVRIFMHHQTRPIYQRPAHVPYHEIEFTHRFSIDVAGQKWVIETFALPKFKSASSGMIPFILFLMGSSISLLIFWATLKHRQHSKNERDRTFQYAKLYRESNEAVKARDEFLSIASHELKTPVTALKLQFQMAQKKIDKNDLTVYAAPAVQKRINTAIIQLDRMNKLINDMLETARFSSGKITLERVSVNLNHLVEDILGRFQEQLEVEGLEILFDRWEGSISVIGDRFRLEQVISNLITNAMKYGKGAPVKIRSFQQDEKAVISISDKGIGISHEAQDRIFHRFERAISSNEVSGLGLGLFISRKIVEAHQGHIRVESILGQGSTFFVELPLEIK